MTMTCTLQPLLSTTQEGLEEIFAQYAQTIEAFRTTNTNTAYHVEEEVIEEEDNEWEDQQEGIREVLVRQLRESFFIDF